MTGSRSEKIMWRQVVARRVMIGFCCVMSVGLTATAAVRAGNSGPVKAAAGPVVRTVQDMPVVTAAADKVDADSDELLKPVAVVGEQTMGSLARSETKTLVSKGTSAAAKLSVARHIRMTVTAYCPCKICCGRNAHGVTASGKRVTYDGGRFVAADPRLFPMGTVLSIPGYHNGRPVEVIDTGSEIKGRHIDVFFPSHQQAKEWGVKVIDVAVAD